MAMRRAGWAGNQSVGVELYHAEKGIKELLQEIDNLGLLHEAGAELDPQIQKLEALAAKAREMI